MTRLLVPQKNIRSLPQAQSCADFRRSHTAKMLLPRMKDNPLDTAERLFDPGYELERHGHSIAAQAHYQEVVKYLEQMLLEDCSYLTGTTLARISLAHGIRLAKLRRFSAAIAPLMSSIRFVDATLDDCVGCELIEVLASAVGWLALAQRITAQHDAAKLSYQRAVGLWRSLILFSRDSFVRLNHQRALAATLFGEAKNFCVLGQYVAGCESRTESTNLFRMLRGLR